MLSLIPSIPSFLSPVVPPSYLHIYLPTYPPTFSSPPHLHPFLPSPFITSPIPLNIPLPSSYSLRQHIGAQAHRSPAPRAHSHWMEIKRGSRVGLSELSRYVPHNILFNLVNLLLSIDWICDGKHF